MTLRALRRPSVIRNPMVHRSSMARWGSMSLSAEIAREIRKMARKGGYRAPGNYDPRRGKKGKSAAQDRGRAPGAGRSDGPARSTTDRSIPRAAERDSAARGRETDALPALSEPPAARLDAKITRPAEVAGMTFAELGLGDNIVRSLAELGAAEPFAIQAATIPDALAGHHVLGRGRTGSGKTIAFRAALVERLLRLKAEGASPAAPSGAKPHRGERQAGGRRADRSEGRSEPRRPKALILAPTRELALQIDRTVQPIARSVGLFTGQFVGGQPFEPQL